MLLFSLFSCFAVKWEINDLITFSSHPYRPCPSLRINFFFLQIQKSGGKQKQKLFEAPKMPSFIITKFQQNELAQ
jgi:hypothetical protein